MLPSNNKEDKTEPAISRFSRQTVESPDEIVEDKEDTTEEVAEDKSEAGDSQQAMQEFWDTLDDEDKSALMEICRQTMQMDDGK